ncbi:glycosyl transferase family 1, partial [Mycobacterium sp. E3251]|uniref:glycosyltransferase n=2 Tax=unclassified Mycobacterium TaxID=2642494 RepID=UPI0007FFF26C
MKLVLASYGTRGDVEPSLVVGRELLRRGHDVRMAVPPDSVAFTEAAGLPAVPYGLESQAWLDLYRNFWTSFFSGFWRVRELRSMWREMWDISDQCWAQMNTTLLALADGADLLFAGQSYQEPAANVAEYYDIPFATLHHVPMRPNGQTVSMLPAPLSRSAMTAFDWFSWRLNKKVEDTQRRELGLPKATHPSPRRIAQRKSLEIQAYDEVCFPGLADEWAKWDGLRPFVGPLTMQLTTGADDDVAAWIAAGSPPICFGFGSMPVESPVDTVEMIAAACAELHQRALICAGWSDFSDVPHFDHVKVVGVVNYASVFPACRAVVHHGGSGTTAASLRAGIPTLILWSSADQPYWGNQIKRLKVGTARRFSETTE